MTDDASRDRASAFSTGPLKADRPLLASFRVRLWQRCADCVEKGPLRRLADVLVQLRNDYSVVIARCYLLQIAPRFAVGRLQLTFSTQYASSSHSEASFACRIADLPADAADDWPR